jgi:hypothetical protein
MSNARATSVSDLNERLAYRRVWFVVALWVAGLLTLSIASSKDSSQTDLTLKPLFGLSEGEPSGKLTGYWALREDVLMELAGRGLSKIAFSSSPCGGDPNVSITGGADVAITQIASGSYTLDTRYAKSNFSVLIVRSQARPCQISTDPRIFYFRVSVN